jgi:lipopolysaccharide transport system permease protein
MSNRIVIEAGKPGGHYWKDLKTYRGLFFFLAWRDVLVRYKQTFIGVAWSVLRPLLTIFAFSGLGFIFNAETSGIPRPLLVAAAVLPWNLFATAFSESANSLVGNANLLTKVYFPRIIVPASTIIVSLIDFCVALVLMVILQLIYGFAPTGNIIFFPLFLLLAILTAAGSGFLIAALNVKYRDFRYVVPFIVQLGLFISPIAFESTTYIYNNPGIPEAVKFIYAMNPMVGVIDGFRWCLLGGDLLIYWPAFYTSIAVSVLIFILGIRYFRRVESSFADFV